MHGRKNIKWVNLCSLNKLQTLPLASAADCITYYTKFLQMTNSKLIQCREVQALKIISIQTGNNEAGSLNYSLIILIGLIQVNITTNIYII